MMEALWSSTAVSSTASVASLTGRLSVGTYAPDAISDVPVTASNVLSDRQLSFNIVPAFIDIIYAVVGCFGFVINTFIFIILVTQRSQNANFAEFLMMSQVLIDAAIGFTVFLFKMVKHSPEYSYTLADRIYCKVIGSQMLEFTLMTASIYNLINIIITQYLDIIYPTSKITAAWKRHLKAVVICPWIVSLLYHSGFDLYYADVVYGSCNYAFVPYAGCKFAVAMMFFIHVIVPTFAFCFTFPRMVKRMRKSAAAHGQQQVPTAFHHARINMLRTLALLFVTFIICISGSNMLIFLAVAGAISFDWINTPLFQVSIALYFADAIVNPFIFGLKYNRFQHGLKRFLVKYGPLSAKIHITSQMMN